MNSLLISSLTNTFLLGREKKVTGVYEEILHFLPRATSRLNITYKEIQPNRMCWETTMCKSHVVPGAASGGNRCFLW